MKRKGRAERRAKPPPPVSRASDHYWLKVGLIVGLTVLAYLPAYHGAFIWDDEFFVGWAQARHALQRFWLTTELPDYWPLTNTLWWACWQLWGNDPLPYHVLNVGLHIGNALLIWQVLARLRLKLAWLAALLFALHPVNVTTAAWVTEIKNTLSLFLALLSLLAYFRFEDTKFPRWYGAALLLFLLALLSKSSVVMLPVVLLAILWWRNGRIERRDLLRSLPFFAIAGAMAVVTLWFSAHRAGAVISRPEAFPSRLAAAGWAVWFYIGKALVPLQLKSVYPRWQVDAGALVSWLPDLALVAVAAVATAGCWQRRGWGKAVLFTLGYVLVTLAPILGFFPNSFMLYSLVADHWQYLAIIGVIALAVAGGGRLAERGPPALRQGLIAVAALVTVAFALLSYDRAGAWQDPETFWQDTLARNPDAWVAEMNIGSILLSRGRVDEAIGRYEAALLLNPDYSVAHNNLGRALLFRNRVDEAVGHFGRALTLNPDFAQAHNNLANVLARQGKVDEAIGHYEAAVRLSPDYALAHVNLGSALLQQGRTAEAIAHYREALEISPDFAEAQNRLSAALFRQSQDQSQSVPAPPAPAPLQSIPAPR